MPYTIDLAQLTQYDNLELVAKQVVEGFITGIHKSPMHGFSVEFAEHRAYNTGEPTKHIDWKLFAKTDKLFVKRYEEETNLRCHIIIDNSSSMYFPVQEHYTMKSPNKILFSVYTAAALMQIFKQQRDAVGLSIFSDTLELHTSAHGGDSHYKMLYRELEKVMQPIGTEIHRKSMIPDNLHRIAEEIHRRSLVVIFSDMFDNQENHDELMLALQHLRHNKHEVILFHTYQQRTEQDFNFENRFYRFMDMESDKEIKLHAHQIREHYRQAMGSFFKDLSLKCAQFQIDMIPADIEQGFNQVLFPYLLKRQTIY